MGDRLKQIWAGFEETTTRHLTGKGVDNIIVPQRADYAAEDQSLLPEGFEGPSTRAFEALHAELAAKQKKFGRKRGPSKRAETGQGEEARASYSGDDVIKGMRATAMRTERTEIDYEAYLASDAGKAIRKKTRKKRFGIF